VSDVRFCITLYLSHHTHSDHEQDRNLEGREKIRSSEKRVQVGEVVLGFMSQLLAVGTFSGLR
jgi:hypothetical protein